MSLSASQKWAPGHRVLVYTMASPHPPSLPVTPSSSDSINSSEHLLEEHGSPLRELPIQQSDKKAHDPSRRMCKAQGQGSGKEFWEQEREWLRMGPGGVPGLTKKREWETGE